MGCSQMAFGQKIGCLIQFKISIRFEAVPNLTIVKRNGFFLVLIEKLEKIKV